MKLNTITKALACSLAVALGSSAHAAVVTITWQGPDAAGTKVGTFYTTGAGAVKLATPTSYSASALSFVDDKGQSFLAYCIEPETSLARKGLAKEYTSSLMDTSSGKGKLLEGLYSQYFGGLSTADQKAAFQVAVWEVMRENTSVLDVANGKGSFYVASGTSSTVVSAANSYLAGALSYSGPSRYQLTQLSSGQYQDLVVAQAVAVPEPQSYALFLAGLSTIGLLARRRMRG